ncbi:energy-coupling factor transporter ATP-binding protein EcfA2 [Clostridium saccharoperbutylacetonicum]|uniref:Putative ATPase n=2 Tax=Clostridium saccharoperbutylacetonicum TaxID=36745 RepID=M1LW80_9CLOT|nr:AAA family ATPase [Clostridium saccharoperbutylacetonicum]AGF57445.1 putative ATPase [Clostridium saccharoperbutylacetonicum N1-4(HMT)]NRT61789.1 energy-coupling factor transporter ATP-binding protein EcfA2 [Clostridium saccharoperbutylacetonicum]NSB25114.1 energy-coupling factor transporter ATP-binding protein EcfA2 [Clostridium saccharoperbutylacetonicum]NSB44485.1 energy-coupling factor transporter ATP-binding protein EcfA2 [Clostridium saccharoperbutylacetonicum]
MSMQLLYTYINDINRCLYKQEFCFTNNFKINYNEETRQLIIEKQENYYKSLWGKRISNVNLLIGQNGAGKTTLFDLLGSQRDRRANLFNDRPRVGRTKCASWFSIYHIEKNIFVIEGIDLGLFKNLYGVPEDINPEYSIVIKYECETKKIKFIAYTQMYYRKEKENISLDQEMIILYGQNLKEKQWLKKERVIRRADYYVGFKRIYLDIPKITNIYKFMSKEYKLLEESFTAKEIECKINFKLYNSDKGSKKEIEKEFDLNLYNNKEEILYFKAKNTSIRYMEPKVNKAKWNIQQEYIIIFYECYIVGLWMDGLKDNGQKMNIDSLKKEISNLELVSDDFFSRVDYLQKVIGILFKEISEIYQIDKDENYYEEAIIKFGKSLQNLNIKYFQTHENINIKLNDGFDENIYELLETYCTYTMHDINKQNDLYNYVDIFFSNLSNGEIDFINGFSNLYTALDIEKYNKRFKSALIILDEPDESFHPEWSRKYIYYLIEFLNKASKIKNLKYQIIISTHSPFMISDVPKEFIICLKVEQNENGEIERKTVKANFGLMSNFYDIIRDDFFISSPIGEFANKIFKQIINKIDIMEEYNKNNIEELIGIISGIDDQFIKKKLLDYLDKKKVKLMTQDVKEKRIKELEEEIRRLKEEDNKYD